ncbi:MAG: hypothetical protein KUA35_00880 [Pseudodesulfovibrio sp.]|uniref:Broad-specificity ulvan lyase N-terminal domain-containing protein n=1 Tax=Pseudodesulfovibrio aespoeensis (strain ATCC 700646 / DSM 10631 / Aspo-2) TaxID=643562 RepID=E6VZK2_PSEA9|nr:MULTISPECIES: hypothetical protein [Pseudodesulfovibrio]MBU4475987.1 hypothetical protein [Pseudomonadota bacterium]ADU61716.1 hypothetical protein Daes_0699 [Pseudodesulfovibrio aespoeensis Aspo-2]MBU4515760.1 hypothetical protein [Pseudomonadota bacterium]MBU4520774.1 hypothetical protein [Pseudomonadota bacterium]MBU4557630.1 hypothetical protein [Pseudomonadota bacterium]
MTNLNTGLSLKSRKSLYRQEILRVSHQLLSSQDRCPVSASCGSFDREFWGWATKDFANMDLQRGCYILAFVYSKNFEGNVFFNEATLIDWIGYGVDCWQRSQKSDGSFDHLYLHEKSWMAAAFTLVDMLLAYRLVADNFDDSFKKKWLRAMERAGDCLINRDEEHGFISNHRLGAAAGLMMLSTETGNSRYRDRAAALFAGVLKKQSEEGWFVEYGGADPGYETLGLHYMSILYVESGKSPEVLHSARKSIGFFSHFIHPDGSIGGDYGSRGCPHFFPGGMEVFARHIPLANRAAEACAHGLYNKDSCGVHDADIRNLIPLATSYAWALSAPDDTITESDSAKLPMELNVSKVWAEAGICVRSDATHYTVFGASKGGVVKIYDKTTRQLVFSSCGYTGITTKKKHVTTLMHSVGHQMACSPAQDDRCSSGSPISLVEVQAPLFHFFPSRLNTPLRFLLFRLFNHTIGRIRRVNDLVRKHLIIGFFLKRRTPPLGHVCRQIRFDSSGIHIRDSFALSEGNELISLKERGFFSSVYMASARYFRAQDLRQHWTGDELVVQGRIIEGVDRHIPRTPQVDAKTRNCRSETDNS